MATFVAILTALCKTLLSQRRIKMTIFIHVLLDMYKNADSLNMSGSTYIFAEQLKMTEDQLEQETLGWLAEAGYTALYGPDIACDGSQPERANYQQVVLVERLRAAADRLNPSISAAAREDAVKQVLDLGIPALLSANRHFHKLLVGGVPVEFQKDGETRGDLFA